MRGAAAGTRGTDAMRRASVVAGVLSLIGSAVALALVVALRDPVSMYSAIAVVLLANAGVRFRMAADTPSDDPER